METIGASPFILAERREPSGPARFLFRTADRTLYGTGRRYEAGGFARGGLPDLCRCAP